MANEMLLSTSLFSVCSPLAKEPYLQDGLRLKIGGYLLCHHLGAHACQKIVCCRKDTKVVLKLQN